MVFEPRERPQEFKIPHVSFKHNDPTINHLTYNQPPCKVCRKDRDWETSFFNDIFLRSDSFQVDSRSSSPKSSHINFDLVNRSMYVRNLSIYHDKSGEIGGLEILQNSNYHALDLLKTMRKSFFQTIMIGSMQPAMIGILLSRIKFIAINVHFPG